MAMKARMPGGPRQTATSLSVVVEMWATPRVGETMDQTSEPGYFFGLTKQASQWMEPPEVCSTPRARDGKQGGTDCLGPQASIWPTPRVMPGNVSRVNGREYETSLPSMARKGLLSGYSLPDQPTTSSGGRSSENGRTSRPRLNPRFTGWLMNLPLGWSELYPIEHSNFARWATESSRRVRQLLSLSFTADLPAAGFPED